MNDFVQKPENSPPPQFPPLQTAGGRSEGSKTLLSPPTPPLSETLPPPRTPPLTSSKSANNYKSPANSAATLAPKGCPLRSPRSAQHGTVPYPSRGEICTCGGWTVLAWLGVWESGSLGVWESGSLGVWESGSLGVWESGSLGNYSCERRYPNALLVFISW